jgi:type IV pilus assembly protein PilY1
MNPTIRILRRLLLSLSDKGTRIGHIRGFALVFSAFLVVLLPAPVLGVTANLPFDHGDWNWHDCDTREDTSYTATGNQLIIAANGDDVWQDDDEYAARYLNDINGDFEVSVKIIIQQNTDSWAKTGIMVRDDITGNGNSDGYCMISITPKNGYAFQWDDNDDGFLNRNSNTGNHPHSSYPSWVKLKKAGTTFTGYYSLNGTDWVEVESQDIPSAAAVQDLGLFVSSHTDHKLCSVQFEDFKTDTIGAGTHTITPTAGDHGSISPSEAVEVVDGNDQTFTVTPDEGYEVDQVEIETGVTELTGSEYTFTNVTTDHTIHVTFTEMQNVITATAGDHGSISPSSGVSVTYGASQTFAVTPDTGYGVEQVLVDSGVTVLTGSQYTFQSVTSDHTISVTFAALVQTITASGGSNGSISPSGVVSVGYGEDRAFTVTPAEGYQVDQLLIDGNAAALTDNQYTFENVTANHTISVTFTDVPTVSNEVPGCDVNSSTDYTSGFDASLFDLNNIGVENGKLVLQTGQQAVDPESIVIPFKQEVSVTFLFEGAGYVSDFGYVLYEDAVDAAGNFKGWNNIPTDKRHPVFHNMYDEAETDGCCSGGDGVLDTNYGNGSFPTSDETAISTYDDGTGLSFAVNGDGQVTAGDMRKVLGTFEAGTELVFFLTADKDWDTMDTTDVFFTKKDWNPDTYDACTSGTSFFKVYHLDQASLEGGCTTEGGWLAQTAVDRLNNDFGVTLSGDYNLPIDDGAKFSHVIVGAPANDPNQWILGWEDLSGGGDADHNDMVFRIERRTGGVAQLKSSEGITPSGDDSYYTAITLQVWDNMPCAGQTDITYWLSVDDGGNWVEITNWDEIKASDANKAIGDDVTDWTPGTPQYTIRTVRIDFASLGISGRELIWKAQLESENETCSPEILDVGLTGTVATHGSFSRASPVVQTNVLYSGSYETPALGWTEKVLRGHLKATRLYDPDDPTQTDAFEIWDAGEVLNGVSPDARTIYFPDVTVTGVTSEVLATGDGLETAFSGTLANHPLTATTITITDQAETFTDKHTDELEGSLGGTGTINRFTGAYEITFNSPPGSGVPINASYSYYTASKTLKAFNTTNVSNAMLGLDAEYVEGEGYTYDLENDDDFDESDGDWLVQWVRGYSDGSSTKKEWLLGPVDHSIPAVASPPGRPQWYFGTALTDTERASFDTFRESLEERQTVVYVGARDGMIHAFDAGKFRWGDNPETAYSENRGYFLWETSGDSSSANYGTGSELWAFIPANLIPRLKNNLLQGDDKSMVDASPALCDVKVDIDDGNGAIWRTVLISAEGNGGDSLFCLDVTDPANPFFMWEFADPDLFRSRSSPAVAQIGRITVNGETKWAAFFVSGKTYDAGLYPSVYIIDIANGSVIQRVYLNADPDGAGGVPSGQPALADSDGNGYIDRIYIGTDKGFMYKVNIPDDPTSMQYSLNHCIINTDFDCVDGEGSTHTVPVAQRYHPIYAEPVVVVDNGVTETGEISYNVMVLFGTGDDPNFDENINTAETTYHFFVYSDQDEKGGQNPANLHWFFELPEGHRIFASAFAAAGQVYFGTSTAETADPCSATEEGGNEGMLYVFRIEDRSPVYSAQVGNITTTPLVDDQHLYYRTSSGLTSLGGGQYNNEGASGGLASTTVDSWREID